MPPIDLSVVVAPLLSESFGPTGDLPAGPNPDVKMFVEDKRPIPVSTGVLECAEKSGVLVDCPGGLLVVHELAAKAEGAGEAAHTDVVSLLPAGVAGRQSYDASLVQGICVQQACSCRQG